MNKNEFLKGLEEALLENMDISQAAPHIKYYNDYIDSEIEKGKSEAEVIASLQSPRLIAKSIIDNRQSAGKYDNNIKDKRTASLSASGSVARTKSAFFSFASLSANEKALGSSGLGYSRVVKSGSGFSCSLTTYTCLNPSSERIRLTGIFPVPLNGV